MVATLITADIEGAFDAVLADKQVYIVQNMWDRPCYPSSPRASWLRAWESREQAS